MIERASHVGHCVDWKARCLAAESTHDSLVNERNNHHEQMDAAKADVSYWRTEYANARGGEHSLNVELWRLRAAARQLVAARKKCMACGAPITHVRMNPEILEPPDFLCDAHARPDCEELGDAAPLRALSALLPDED
jgi:hypothetical protein